MTASRHEFSSNHGDKVTKLNMPWTDSYIAAQEAAKDQHAQPEKSVYSPREALALLALHGVKVPEGDAPVTEVEMQPIEISVIDQTPDAVQIPIQVNRTQVAELQLQ